MEAQQEMAGESLLPKHVELLTPFSYSATKKPKVRPNYRLLLGLVGVTIILGWLLILTSKQNRFVTERKPAYCEKIQLNNYVFMYVCIFSCNIQREEIFCSRTPVWQQNGKADGKYGQR